MQETFEMFLKGRVFEYAAVSTGSIAFSPELLKACERNLCGKYNTCWTCPPAVGPMETLMEKIKRFSHTFVFTTKTDLEDSFDYEGMMKAKEYHDLVTREMHGKFGRDNPVFGAGSCKICEKCAYPEPCRHPDKIYPSIEAAGINVTELSRAAGVHYNNGENTVTYFTMILYNE
jgi:predicted metal-binding protein